MRAFHPSGHTRGSYVIHPEDSCIVKRSHYSRAAGNPLVRIGRQIHERQNKPASSYRPTSRHIDEAPPRGQAFCVNSLLRRD